LKNHRIIVKYLVKNGTNSNKTNKYGEIPILITRKIGNETLIKYLVKHGIT